MERSLDNQEYDTLLKEVDQRYFDIKENIEGMAMDMEEVVPTNKAEDKTISFYSSILQLKTRKEIKDKIERAGVKIIKNVLEQKSKLCKEGEDKMNNHFEELVGLIQKTSCFLGYPLLISFFLFLVQKEQRKKRTRELWCLICRAIGLADEEELEVIRRIVHVVSENVPELKGRIEGLKYAMENKKQVETAVKESHQKKQTNKRKQRERKKLIREANRFETRKNLKERKDRDEAYKKKMNKLHDLIHNEC